MTPDVEEVIFKQTVAPSVDSSSPTEIRPENNEVSSLNVSIPFHLSVCRSGDGKPSCAVDFRFEVYSDSNQKWTEIQWKPKLTFTPDEITDEISSEPSQLPRLSKSALVLPISTVPALHVARHLDQSRSI